MRSQLGPEHARAPVAGLLERARVAARLCGVTRLADITGLDRLGFPVWQAVRPAGRSLSVHQGKGASPGAAQIGALCEAIEAHCAEQVAADGPRCSFDDMPQSERAPEIGDYCRTREVQPQSGVPIQWCDATDLATGKPQYLPHDLISLDYTRGLPSPFERASSGLGAGATPADALQISLFEAIERDAVGEWRRLSLAERLATAVRTGTIPFDWFRLWAARFASLDIDFRVFRAVSIVSVPVFICVIGGVEAFGSAYRRFYGTSAHNDPEIALFKALAEAIQSRLTLIASVRDDVLPSDHLRERRKPAVHDEKDAGRPWDEDGPRSSPPELLADRLAARGYARIAVKRLDNGLDGVVVTKAFIPGLGSLSRTRRAAQ